MCGIAGWLGAQPADVGIAGRMMRALHHRGPDGQGVKSWSEATLIHTRLSIIDVSPSGATQYYAWYEVLPRPRRRWDRIIRCIRAIL